MKKLLTLTVLALMVSAIAFGQAYKKSDRVIQGGIGFGMAGLYGKSSLPPISAVYEMGTDIFEGKLSVGGLAGISGSSEEINVITGFIGFIPQYGTIKYSYTYIILGARAAYHYPLMNNVDTYGGAMLGYNIVSSSITAPVGYPTAAASGSFLAYGGFIGAKYFLSPNFGLYAEVGYGIGFLNVGIAYKL